MKIFTQPPDPIGETGETDYINSIGDLEKQVIEATNIRNALEGLQVLENRTPETPGDDEGKVFATLAETERSGVYAGSFNGESAWERHRNGDELVQVIAGATRLSILTDTDRKDLDMSEGMVTIVPKGCWHKFTAPTGVTVMTMTPSPTDHSAAEDPRETE